ncbi:MAG: hypothetical protein IIU43_04120, partial [Thermoguttaceae bacterium]|nr:hypothetical protein [Thermoguttaceae bacterium]
VRGDRIYLYLNGNGKYDSGEEYTFQFGDGVDPTKYTPVVGDFDGDGIDTVSFFQDGNWLIDVDGDGQYYETVKMGSAGDEPIVGDWDGDGKDGIGVVRGSSQQPGTDAADRFSNSNADPDQQVGDLAMN